MILVVSDKTICCDDKVVVGHKACRLSRVARGLGWESAERVRRLQDVNCTSNTSLTSRVSIHVGHRL